MSMVMMMAAVHKHETTSIHDSMQPASDGEQWAWDVIAVGVWPGFVL